MGTSAETFKISQLQEFRDADGSKKYQIEVPAFQRGLVWSAQKKTALINSIARGFPIGALLMYERPSASGPTLLQIIDGLQRSTAILDYMKHPLEIAPVTDEFIEEETFTEIASACQRHGVEIGASEVRDSIDTWAKATKVTRMDQGFTSKRLREAISSKVEKGFSLELADELDEILSAQVIQVLNDKFQALNNYEIPVILYSGDEADLPHIFESLNSGTPLTKYDKFGATWSSTMVVTKNRDVRASVRDRYSVYADSDWDVSNFNPNVEFEEDDLNLFEYLGGLGHVLSEKYPSIFSEHRVKDEVPSWAFAIATLAHGLRLGDMSELPKKLKRNAEGQLDPNPFEKALIEACEILESSLGQYLSLKLNSKSANDRFIPHSENQVNSLLARLMVETFDPETWLKRPGSTQIDLLRKNILPHYLFDILKDAWKGSGDSTAFKRVWDERPDKSLAAASYYLQAISGSELEKSLDEFHASELKKSQSNRANISMKTRLLLRVIYADIISHKDNKAVQFEIEHLHPVKELTDFVLANGIDGLPISALGNLAILPQKDNLIKGKNYLGDYLLKNSKSVNEIEKLQAYIISPNVSLVNKASLRDEGSYVDFCKARFEAQTSQIMKTLQY